MAVAIAAVALSWQTVKWAMRSPVFTVHAIQLDATLDKASLSGVRASALPRLSGNFFSIDLDAAREDLPAEAPDVEPAGVAAEDAAVDAAQEQVVEVHAAEAVRHPEHPVVGGGRPGGVEGGGVDLLHGDVAHRGAAGEQAGEGDRGGRAGHGVPSADVEAEQPEGGARVVHHA